MRAASVSVMMMMMMIMIMMTNDYDSAAASIDGTRPVDCGMKTDRQENTKQHQTHTTTDYNWTPSTKTRT